MILVCYYRWGTECSGVVTAPASRSWTMTPPSSDCYRLCSATTTPTCAPSSRCGSSSATVRWRRTSKSSSMQTRGLQGSTAGPTIYRPATKSILLPTSLTDESSRVIVCDYRCDDSLGLKSFSDTHRSYDPLSYPLLFPYGTDGFHIGLPCSGSSQASQTKCDGKRVLCLPSHVAPQHIQSDPQVMSALPTVLCRHVGQDWVGSPQLHLHFYSKLTRCLIWKFWFPVQEQSLEYVLFPLFWGGFISAVSSCIAQQKIAGPIEQPCLLAKYRCAHRTTLSIGRSMGAAIFRCNCFAFCCAMQRGACLVTVSPFHNIPSITMFSSFDKLCLTWCE